MHIAVPLEPQKRRPPGSAPELPEQSIRCVPVHHDRAISVNRQLVVPNTNGHPILKPIAATPRTKLHVMIV